MTKTSELARALKPFVQSWFSEWNGGVGYRGGASSGGSGGSGTVGAHDLFNTTIHTGQLLESQATWAATKVELTTHASLPNVHHAQVHELASASGLGADHTISGATVGHVLRATSSTAAAFAQLQHSDLGGVTANQHHNQIHDIVGSDHTITAAAWNVPGSTALNTLGLLQARSSTLGTAETLLKSDGAGGIYLSQLGINTNSPARLFHILDNTGAQMRLGYDASNYMDFLVDNGGSWRVAPTGDIIFDPTGNDVRPLNNYDINLGTPYTKYLTLYAAELWVDTLVANEVRSTIGGKVNVAPTTELTRDLAGATLTYDTITQRGTTTSNSGTGTPGGLNTITQRGTTTTNTATGGASAITQRGTATSATGTTGVTLNLPTGVVANDVLVVFITTFEALTPTPPSGWTLLYNNPAGTYSEQWCYYRVAGASEPSSYSWSYGGTDEIVGSMSAWYNVDTTTPIDAYLASDDTTAGTTQVADAITIITNGALLLAAAGFNNDTTGGTTTSTPPSGMTELSDTAMTQWTWQSTAYQAGMSTGSTGTRTFTLNQSVTESATALVALRPAAGGNTSLSVTKPTGTVDNDVLIATVAYAGGTLTPPAGWTSVLSQAATGVTLAVYRKIAASEGSSYTWSLNSADGLAVSLSTYYNVNTTTPVNASNSQANASSTSMTAPTVTPGTTADMLIFAGAVAGNIRATAPGGMTEDADVGNTGVGVYMADQLLASSSATGSKTATLASATANAAALVVLNPSSSSAVNTSFSVAKPTGTVNNDVMIAAVAFAGGTLTAPAGWTQTLSRAGTGTTLRVYQRVASSEGSSYTWALDSTDGLAVAISTYYNVNTTTPVAASGSQANSSSTSMTAPTVTPTAPSGMLVFAGAVAGNYRATAPGGMTEDADVGATGVGVYIADQSLSAIDATGTRVATLASAAANAAANVYLLPSSTGGAAPTTIYVKYNNLNNGDRVLLEARGQFEAMAVASTYTIITAGEEYSYTVTRNLDGTGANDWVAGDAVLNTGQTGNGWLELYAQYGLAATGETSNQRVGPTMVGNVRQSNTWNDFGPRFAAGSLNGLYDYATTVYGFAAGNPNGAWVALDDTNGLRFMSTLATVGYIQPGGNWRFNGNASNYIHWDGSALHVRGDIVVSGAVDWNNVTGSPNLVRNSSFELDSDATGAADFFTVYTSGAVGATGSIVSAERSPKAQRIAWTGTNTGRKGIYFDITETKANDVDYVLSFWARTNTATSVEFYETGAAATKTWLTAQTTSTTWTYYAVRLRWPTAGGAPAANFYISILDAAAISNGWIEFDNVQVTRGSERVPYTASPVDIVGYGGVINMPFPTAGTIASGLYLTNNYMGYWNGTNWRSYIQSNGNAYFGNGSTQYMNWNGTTLTISGSINVVSGGTFTGVNYAGSASAGGAANSIAGQGALATQSSVTWSTQVTGTGKPADNATVGATWGSNLASIPVRFQDTPSSNGLYLTASALGFYNGGWTSYFDNAGNFFFGYSASNRIEYNASANQLRGIGGGNVQWYASGSNGYLYAGGGAAGVSSRGVEILRSGGSLTRALQFVTAIGTGERAAAIDVYTDTNPILPYYNQNTLWIETFATTGKAFHSIRMVSQTIEMAAGVYASSFDAGDVGGNWTAIPFGTGWGNYGGGYQACQYMRFGNIVFLRGLALLSSGTGANIGNLPSGYRPTSGQVLKGCQASSGLARIDITTAGAINVVGGATTGMWVYIDHTFFTA